MQVQSSSCRQEQASNTAQKCKMRELALASGMPHTRDAASTADDCEAYFDAAGAAEVLDSRIVQSL